jgi:ferredoxin
LKKIRKEVNRVRKVVITLPLLMQLMRLTSRCMNCGHCEVFCPSEALLLDFHLDEKISLLAGAGTISPEDIALYF